MESIREIFNNHFEIIPANIQKLLDISHQLRYQIYCVENGFEGGPKLFPDGRERDFYESRSVTCLLQHRASGEYAGTVRLVLADPENHLHPFPIETYAQGKLDLSYEELQKLPRRYIAEISRLAISNRFRRRLTVEYKTGVHKNKIPALTFIPDRRHLPDLIILGLYAAAVRMSIEHRIMYWYALMQPALAKLLRRSGFSFQHSIGPQMEWYGIRQPYLVSVHEELAGVKTKRPDVWDLLTDGGHLVPQPPDPLLLAGHTDITVPLN